MDDDKDLPDATPDRDYDTLAELPEGATPPVRPKVPSTLPPPGSCDCHLHVPGGRQDAPETAEGAQDPAPVRGFDGWIDLLRTHLDTLGIDRGVIVQSSLSGADDSVVPEALDRLGAEFRGVALVADDAGAEAIARLADRRMAGVRLNLVDGGALSLEGATALAPRLADHGMHLQVMLRAADDLEGIAEDIRRLPVPVVIDHCGLPDAGGGIDASGFSALRGLVSDGVAYVKLSGLYRFAGGASWDRADPFVAALAEANPEQCLWGSDWPHPMPQEGERPDAGNLLDAFFRVVTASADRQRILVDNPATLYRF